MNVYQVHGSCSLVNFVVWMSLWNESWTATLIPLLFQLPSLSSIPFFSSDLHSESHNRDLNELKFPLNSQFSAFPRSVAVEKLYGLSFRRNNLSGSSTDIASVRSFPASLRLSSTSPFRLTCALARNGMVDSFENSETQLPIYELPCPYRLG
jgi:hypothetical protein